LETFMSALFDDIAVPDIDWHRLGHVYVFANGKGGVGKTTSAANLAGLAAAAGRRVLLIDLNGQGNVAEDLGYTATALDDQGQGLLAAIVAGAPLTPVPGVRPQLDVVPGGEHIRRIAPSLYAQLQDWRAAERAVVALARCLEPLAERYDLIVIDSPPENPPLVQLALAAARFVVVPMRTDEASRKGLREVARDFRLVRRLNPALTLLGVFVFASSTAATRIRAGLQANVEKDLGGAAPVFATVIRHSEAVAVQARERGCLAHELAVQAASGPKSFDVAAGRADRAQVVSATAAVVAGDYAALAREVFARAARVRAQAEKAGVWP
jgi:cellulose biosynthesis protein BcsQ